jgi:predicted PurR-regulated permease PerM
LAGVIISVGTTSIDSVVRLIIFISLLAVLFPSFPNDLNLLKSLSPLDDELDQKYIDKLTFMAKAMVRGVFIIALAQGLAVGFFYWLAGVPYMSFWILLSIFTAMLPLGVNTVAIPIGLVLLLAGKIWQSLLVLGGSLLLVSNLDNLLRPMLVSPKAYLNPAMVLLSAFGGIHLFGLLGVIYGPMIMIFVTTTIEIYLEYYRLPRKATPSSPESAPETIQELTQETNQEAPADTDRLASPARHRSYMGSQFDG